MCMCACVCVQTPHHEQLAVGAELEAVVRVRCAGGGGQDETGRQGLITISKTDIRILSLFLSLFCHRYVSETQPNSSLKKC